MDPVDRAGYGCEKIAPGTFGDSGRLVEIRLRYFSCGSPLSSRSDALNLARYFSAGEHTGLDPRRVERVKNYHVLLRLRRRRRVATL